MYSYIPSNHLSRNLVKNHNFLKNTWRPIPHVFVLSWRLFKGHTEVTSLISGWIRSQRLESQLQRDYKLDNTTCYLEQRLLDFPPKLCSIILYFYKLPSATDAPFYNRTTTESSVLPAHTRKHSGRDLCLPKSSYLSLVIWSRSS